MVVDSGAAVVWETLLVWSKWVNSVVVVDNTAGIGGISGKPQPFLPVYVLALAGGQTKLSGGFWPGRTNPLCPGRAV